MKYLLTSLIRFYQFAISPFLGKHCRFYPTCSEYSKLAIEKYGLRGIAKGLRRFLRCHPFSKGGFDPLE